MEADQFRSALRTRPFKPFTVKTGSGEQYTVRDPETVAISPSGRTIGLALDEGCALLDMASITEFVIDRNRRRKGQ
jgi:hypothetical protein